ncbi:MAG: GtrA family protein [Bacilli bacterium]
MKLIKKYEEIIKYIIAGGLTTVISILSYNILRNFNINYLVCTILSWILAVIFAYFINKYYVFKNKQKNVVEFINFIGARLLSLGIEFLAMYIMVDIITLNDRIAKITVQFIVFILNYIFSKLFVFKK